MELKTIVINGKDENIFYLNSDELNKKMNELKYKIDTECNHFSVKDYSEIEDTASIHNLSELFVIAKNGSVFKIYKLESNAEKELNLLKETLNLEWNKPSLLKFSIVR